MHFNRNTLTETLEVPPYVLCKANGERIGIIPCTQEKTYDANFLEPDEIHFDTNLYINGERNAVYDEIDIWKYVEVPDIGLFVITQISTVAEGTLYESKSVEARSAESQELGQRYVEELAINTGETGSIDGVVFYSPGNPDYSLMHIIMGEKCYNWTFNHIDPELWTMKRSFDWSREAIYDILMEDISQAFECYFTFDSLHRQINAYRTMGKDTNILVTFNNLLEQTELSCDLDEIKTCLTITGSDDLTIREVNMSSDRILNLDYFHDRAYMSEGLYDAYTRWAQLPNTVMDEAFILSLNYEPKSDLRGKTYSQGFEILLDKYQDYYEDLHKEKSLNAPASYNERHLGYGDYYDPADPYNEAKVKHFDEYTHTGDNSGVLYVTSLPTTGRSTNILYIIKDSPTFAMYRWTGTAWFNVNIWTSYALNILNEQLKAAEKAQAVAMKAGYGNPEGDGSSSSTTQERKKKRYIDTYLPAYYTVEAINQQVPRNEAVIKSLELSQFKIESDKNKIITKLSMENPANFTADQLKELNVFIREEELTSDNYIVTDEMTDDERFEMLHDMLDYGTKELAKVAQPQLSFSATLANLFTIPEFDVYSGDFDIGNYIWISIRDDYNIRARLLTIHINFLEQTDFSVTFGNIARTAKTMFTDIQDALNIATSAATSVSMNSSYWSEAAEEADSISDTIQKGLLSQGEYLKNGDDSELVMDARGMFVTTISGDYAYKDSIFIGGGRILFTNDDWKTVVMSVGRALIDYPYIQTNPDGTNVINKITESRFGVFADFLLAGYVGGSLIVGGDIYSDNYQGSSSNISGNAGTHINLRDGTFVFSGKTSGKKRLVLDGNTLTVYGTIQASAGHIGCDDNGNGGFVIDSLKIYNNKQTRTANATGVYIGTDGIGLGAYPSGGSRSAFEVDSAGNLYAASANITGTIYAISGQIGSGNKVFYINSDHIYNGKTGLNEGTLGIYLGTNGIALGRKDAIQDESQNKYSAFTVLSDGSLFAASATIKGNIQATTGSIGGFIITSNSIYNAKDKLTTDAEGVYIGTGGIGLGKIDTNTGKSIFEVDKKGNLYATSANISGKISATSGQIGSGDNVFIIKDNHIYNGKTGLNQGTSGIYLGTDGIALGQNNQDYGEDENHNRIIYSEFTVTKDGSLYAKKGNFGGLINIYKRTPSAEWQQDYAFIVNQFGVATVYEMHGNSISARDLMVTTRANSAVFEVGTSYDLRLHHIDNTNNALILYNSISSETNAETFRVDCLTGNVTLYNNATLTIGKNSGSSTILSKDSVKSPNLTIIDSGGVEYAYFAPGRNSDNNKFVLFDLDKNSSYLIIKGEVSVNGGLWAESLSTKELSVTENGASITGSTYIAGDLYLTGEIYHWEPSDERLKEDIKDLPLEKSKKFISSLSSKEFRFKKDPEKLHHGFIAQDVEETADWDVVVDDPNGMKGINYNEIIADLVSVVQDQEKRISELEAKLASLTK